MNKMYNGTVMMNIIKIYRIITYTSFLVTAATCISFHDPESGEKGDFMPLKGFFSSEINVTIRRGKSWI